MNERSECAEHGRSAFRMICQHLRLGTGLGYARVEAPADGGDYETVMCEACERLLLAENAWTDRLWSYADWEIHCVKCSDRTLEHHTLVATGRMAPE